MLKGYQQKFIQLAVDYEALQFGEFTLKSGRISPYFFNAGRFADGAALSIVAACYAEAINAAGLNFDCLFGPAYKGIPLVAVTAMQLAQQTQRTIPYAFNRKEPKQHGEGGNLVGADLQGKQVLLLDDVITAGTAVRSAIELLQQHQARPAGLITMLDRQERGQTRLSAVQELEQEFQMPVTSIISFEQLLQYVQTHAADYYQSLANYRDKYGIK